MKLLHVVGARPNFMKVSPVWRAVERKTSFDQVLVHTGQHYARNMSDVFFEDLELPRPDHHLNVGSGSHAGQTATIMIALEDVLTDWNPDVVMVYGDVNSTLAAGLVCAKLRIPVGHVEAGLRSFDREMPEEINRLLTDQIADLLFTPSADGDENLLREGVAPEKIHRVGNVMIDTLVHALPRAVDPEGIDLSDRYALVTLHRPSNVDDLEALRNIVSTLAEISESLQVLFPVHPRTRQRIVDFRLEFSAGSQFQLMEPIRYLNFVSLMKGATVVMTDSGGVQEETTYLGVPCLTLRENTERPVTVNQGTNLLVGKDMDALKEEVGKVLSGQRKTGHVPPLWDGHAGDRVVDILKGFRITP